MLLYKRLKRFTIHRSTSARDSECNKSMAVQRRTFLNWRERGTVSASYKSLLPGMQSRIGRAWNAPTHSTVHPVTVSTYTGVKSFLLVRLWFFQLPIRQWWWPAEWKDIPWNQSHPVRAAFDMETKANQSWSVLIRFPSLLATKLQHTSASKPHCSNCKAMSSKLTWASSDLFCLYSVAWLTDPPARPKCHLHQHRKCQRRPKQLTAIILVHLIQNLKK